jgi:hypothetical protein
MRLGEGIPVRQSGGMEERRFFHLVQRGTLGLVGLRGQDILNM